MRIQTAYDSTLTDLKFGVLGPDEFVVQFSTDLQHEPSTPYFSFLTDAEADNHHTDVLKIEVYASINGEGPSQVGVVILETDSLEDSEILDSISGQGEVLYMIKQEDDSNVVLCMIKLSLGINNIEWMEPSPLFKRTTSL
ncbi:hypothetical protein ACKF11_12805 [Methylobacillus sp. Pita2]|uniref:hypothetical protein n=1 Tax=Methylobacillus sp. Pita2 TaxID=3383245 RepID=UPI0038B47607